jgi:hypothetical protein
MSYKVVPKVGGGTERRLAAAGSSSASDVTTGASRVPWTSFALHAAVIGAPEGTIAASAVEKRIPLNVAREGPGLQHPTVVLITEQSDSCRTATRSANGDITTKLLTTRSIRAKDATAVVVRGGSNGVGCRVVYRATTRAVSIGSTKDQVADVGHGVGQFDGASHFRNSGKVMASKSPQSQP